MIFRIEYSKNLLDTNLIYFSFRKYTQQAELCIVDASSNMDENNLKVFIMSTRSVAGALPLSILITNGEKTETQISAFSMWNNILPENAFFQQGQNFRTSIDHDR